MWAAFQVTRGGESEIAGLTLDEEEALSPQNALLCARSEHKSRIERVAAKSRKSSKTAGTSSTPAVKVERNEKISLREKETATMKRRLVGATTQTEEVPETGKTPDTKGWAIYEEQERLRNLDLIRKHRSKQ